MAFASALSAASASSSGARCGSPLPQARAAPSAWASAHSRALRPYIELDASNSMLYYTNSTRLSMSSHEFHISTGTKNRPMPFPFRKGIGQPDRFTYLSHSMRRSVALTSNQKHRRAKDHKNARDRIEQCAGPAGGGERDAGIVGDLIIDCLHRGGSIQPCIG